MLFLSRYRRQHICTWQAEQRFIIRANLRSHRVLTATMNIFLPFPVEDDGPGVPFLAYLSLLSLKFHLEGFEMENIPLELPQITVRQAELI